MTKVESKDKRKYYLVDVSTVANNDNQNKNENANEV